MKILLVTFSNSIHAVRWANQINSQGWEIHLFPSFEHQIHLDFKKINIHDFTSRPPGIDISVVLPGARKFPAAFSLMNRIFKRLRIQPYDYNDIHAKAKRLAVIIQRIKPDVVHSLEIQHGGYLTLEAKKLMKHFPKWIVTNWGSDIFYFGRFEEHAKKIREVLQNCDYYSCECHRDVDLGRSLGFKGEILPVLPNAGGFDLERVKQFRQPGTTSTRRIIVLKGYQGWVYRALVGLQALELCVGVLKDYGIVIYLASPEVIKAATKVSLSTGVPIDILPFSPHDDILRLHGRARISIGLSISDAISTSFLEAIVMGSFPIQSCTSCADEWIHDSETGLIVPPEDPQQIAAAIRRAVTDDELVDQAAEKNALTVKDRLDRRIIQQQIIKMYEHVRAQ